MFFFLNLLWEAVLQWKNQLPARLLTNCGLAQITSLDLNFLISKGGIRVPPLQAGCEQQRRLCEEQAGSGGTAGAGERAGVRAGGGPHAAALPAWDGRAGSGSSPARSVLC